MYSTCIEPDKVPYFPSRAKSLPIAPPPSLPPAPTPRKFSVAHSSTTRELQAVQIEIRIDISACVKALFVFSLCSLASTIIGLSITLTPCEKGFFGRGLNRTDIDECDQGKDFIDYGPHLCRYTQL